MPNLPADVERYVKEMQDKDPSMDDSKAWAVAWSRYCEYKNPGSDHCKQDSYFPGRKQASEEEARQAVAKVIKKLKGKLPPPNKFPEAKAMGERGWGSGPHTNRYRERDVAKGRSRTPKHKGRGDEEAMLAGGPLSLQRDYGSTEEAAECPCASRVASRFAQDQE